MLKRICLVLAVLIPILWCLPTLCGYLSSHPPDRIFLGWIRSDDFHRYGSFIEQTREFHRFFYMDYSTVRPQNPRMIAVYFTVLGWIGVLTGLSAPALWLISRLLVGWGFAAYLYLFLKKYFGEKTSALMFIFVMFSNGFDWLAYRFGVALPRPKNYWMDGFSTFNSFHNPLKIAGLLAGLWLLDRYLRFFQERTAGNFFICSAGILLVWAIHPNTAIPIYVAMAFLSALPRQRSKDLFPALLRQWMSQAVLLIPFGVIFLYVLWMETDPMTARIIKQYHVPFSMEPFWTYPIRYGFILIFALGGVFRIISRWLQKDVEVAEDTLVRRLFLGFLTGALIFSHHPTMTSLLFQHTVHLPLAVLATEPFLWGLQRIHDRRVRNALLSAVLIFFAVGNTVILTKVCRQTVNDVWPTSLYAGQDEITLMLKLRELPPGNVLVNRDTGNKIGWIAMHNAFLGHWGTTPDKGKKIRELKKFYAPGTSTAWRRKFLKRYNITYIWFGPRERKYGLLDAALDLERIGQAGDTALFKYLGLAQE